MSDFVRCDNCRQEVREPQAPGWLWVEHFGIEVSRIEDEPGPWHFCGRECLSSYFYRESARD